MQECGPRFTLKLISLQHGTFDTKGGEYEWVHKVFYLVTESGWYFDPMISRTFSLKKKKGKIFLMSHFFFFLPQFEC